MLRVGGEVDDRSHCSKVFNHPPLALSCNFAEYGIITTHSYDRGAGCPETPGLPNSP